MEALEADTRMRFNTHRNEMHQRALRENARSIYEATASMSAQDVLHGSVAVASSFSTFFELCRYDIKIFELPQTSIYLVLDTMA